MINTSRLLTRFNLFTSSEALRSLPSPRRAGGARIAFWMGHLAEVMPQQGTIFS